MNYILTHFNYGATCIIFCLGLFLLIISTHPVKKLLALSLMQSSAMLFFISIGKVKNAAPPLVNQKTLLYSNPLPQVLMLTAIVVGLAILALGLALAIKAMAKPNESGNQNA